MLLAAAPSSALAQHNYQAGYVITLNNDTIHGSIDYRMPSENARLCVFLPDGKSEITYYQPKDIKGYRFDGDGVFYISRTLTVQDKPKEVFLEYLIQGSVSLYRYRDSFGYTYYFEGEDGTMLALKDDRLNTHEADYGDKLSARIRSMSNVKAVFPKNMHALDAVYKEPFTAENLSNVVRSYDEQYCTDKDCVQFVYDEKKNKNMHPHFRIELGGMYMYMKTRHSEGEFWAPTLSLGVEADMPRLSPGFSTLLMLKAYYAKSVENVKAFDEPYPGSELSLYHMMLLHHNSERITHRRFILELLLGAKWRLLPKRNHSPFVEFGASSIFAYNFGVFAGGGYDFRMPNNHRLQISATASFSPFTPFSDKYDIGKQYTFNAGLAYLF